MLNVSVGGGGSSPGIQRERIYPLRTLFFAHLHKPQVLNFRVKDSHQKAEYSSSDCTFAAVRWHGNLYEKKTEHFNPNI